MKLISYDKEKVVLEFSNEEFIDLNRAVTSVEQEYEGLDPCILRVPEERVVALSDGFGDVLKTMEADARKAAGRD